MINESSEIITDVIGNLEDVGNIDVIGNLEDLSNTDVDLFQEEESISQTENIIDNTTQIQSFKASLNHVQTGVTLELPTQLSVIHIGKPNDKTPPDIDVSGFPHSQVVSRIHADIITEGDNFYLEDTGSANGTYINHTPLPTGNRHRLKNGDRIALGKEDKVSFIFELIS
ncbi:FHA domain-containing protein [Geminocystis sp. CENA526]